eukprot:scaffold92375_cov66-Phaeocystis_antarctica.AAC.4
MGPHLTPACPGGHPPRPACAMPVSRMPVRPASPRPTYPRFGRPPPQPLKAVPRFSQPFLRRADLLWPCARR